MKFSAAPTSLEEAAKYRSKIDCHQRSLAGSDLEQRGIGESQATENTAARCFSARDDNLPTLLDDVAETVEKLRALGLSMLSEQIGRFGERVRRHQNPVDLCDRVDQSLAVSRREPPQPAVSSDQSAIHDSRDKQHEKVGVDEEGRRRHDFSR